MVFKSSLNNGGGGGGGGVTALNGLAGTIALTSTGNTITITPSGSTINLESTGGGSLTVDGITVTGDGTPTNPLVAPFFDNNVFYFYNTASDISGCKVMNITANPNADNIDKFNATDGDLLQSWATLPNIPNAAWLPSGIFSMQISAQQFQGTQTSQIYAEIWEVDASGTDIALIGTTNYSPALVSTPTLYSMVFSSQTVYYTASVASRIEIRVFVHVSGSGSAPGVQINYGQGNNSYMSIPLADIPPHPVTIGDPISGSNINSILYTDPSGNLASSGAGSFDGTNLDLSSGSIAASTFTGNGAALTGVPTTLPIAVSSAPTDIITAIGGTTIFGLDGNGNPYLAGDTGYSGYSSKIGFGSGSDLIEITSAVGLLVHGTTTSDFFAGDGMGLTNLVGDTITFSRGSLDQIPFLASDFTMQFDSGLNYDNAGHILNAPAFSGDGSGLTNITQTQINTASSVSGFTGTCTFDAITPGNITSQTFVNGILTSVTTL